MDGEVRRCECNFALQEMGAEQDLGPWSDAARELYRGASNAKGLLNPSPNSDLRSTEPPLS